MIIIPTSFGSQTLHNLTTHFAMKMQMPADKAEANLIRLPNGTWYDPFLAEPVPALPGKLSATIALVFSSEATLDAEVEAFLNLVGIRAVLTVKKLDATSVNCLARLETVELKHPFNIVKGGKTKIELKFQRVTRFS